MIKSKAYKQTLATLNNLKEEIKTNLPLKILIYKRARIFILERKLELAINRVQRISRRKRIQKNRLTNREKQKQEIKKIYG